MPPTLIVPDIGHVQKRYRAWAKRWSTLAADSFQRVNQTHLGALDTGHDWASITDPVRTYDWVVLGARAKCDPLQTNATGLFASVWRDSGDARITCAVECYGTNGTGLGPGLFFRGARDFSSGWIFCWASGANYKLFQVVGPAPVAYTDTQTFTGTNPAAGQRVVLEVRALGTALSFYVDGVQVGTRTTATYQTQPYHGLFNWVQTAAPDTRPNQFDFFRCLRYVG